MATAWLAGLVFVLSFAFRFLATSGFHNDQFMHLAWTNQVLLGELPYRDFVDPGMPLTYLASLSARLVVAPPLLAEVLLSVTALSLGAALAFALASRASGSRWLGLAAAVLPIVLAPRLYSYPKLVLHLWALWAAWQYADRPDRRRLAGLAVCTAVAFLFRHDHGVFIGLAFVVLLVAVHWPRGHRRFWRRTLQYGGATFALLLPFLAFVQLTTGLAGHLETGLTFNRREHSGQRLEHWPRFAITPPEPSHTRVNIRWAEGLDDDRRGEMTTWYGLEEGAHVSGRTWRYVLTDSSQGNILSLLADPGIEDTHGIDRTRSTTAHAAESPLEHRSHAAADAGWPFVAGLLRPQNAVAWLFAVLVLVPFAGAALLIGTRIFPRSLPELGPGERAFIATAIVLAIATNHGFLRDPLTTRLADASAVPAVLGAWLLGRGWCWLRRGLCAAGERRWPMMAARAGAALVVALAAGLTAAAAAEVGDLTRVLARTELLSGPRRTVERGRSQLRRLSLRPPIDGWMTSGDRALTLKQLTRYVRDCTQRSDRLLLTWFEPEVYFYAERGFAAGLAFFHPGFFVGPDQQQLALSRWQRQRVPIVLKEVRRYDQFFRTEYPRLAVYLDTHYRSARELPTPEGDMYHVLMDQRLTPTGVDQVLALPCFSADERPSLTSDGKLGGF